MQSFITHFSYRWQLKCFISPSLSLFNKKKTAKTLRIINMHGVRSSWGVYSKWSGRNSARTRHSACRCYVLYGFSGYSKWRGACTDKMLCMNYYYYNCCFLFSINLSLFWSSLLLSIPLFICFFFLCNHEYSFKNKRIKNCMQKKKETKRKKSFTKLLNLHWDIKKKENNWERKREGSLRMTERLL